MKSVAIVVLLLASATFAADKRESVDSMKARYEHSAPKDRVELAIKIAEQQVAAMDNAYTDGNIDAARALLADVQHFGIQAAETSASTGKRMKQTEIELRKLNVRLENIRRTLSVDDRAPVGEAIQKIDAARNDLLNRMFRK
jgi:DsbC/DsbD-like thiol-disulfide interchange protein